MPDNPKTTTPQPSFAIIDDDGRLEVRMCGDVACGHCTRTLVASDWLETREGYALDCCGHRLISIARR
jgi:hypothetical protein